MRVIVDGQKQFEREAPGGQTLTFGGDESIALRAGDGGALRLSVGGTDRGIMGRDGQVVNRVFSK